MNKRISLFLLFFLLIGTGGCSLIDIKPLFTPTAPATETPVLPEDTPTPVPTETIVWFPPTSTPRPLNTPTPFPTEPFVMDQGKMIISDDFSDGTNWQTYRSSLGNAVISNNELTLAIQDSKNDIVSFSSFPHFGDYYLSIDVNLSICSYYRDGYGMIFRSKDADNLYRWTFNCRGESRLEKVYKGKVYHLSEWEPNGIVRLSAPQKFSAGIAAEGSHLSFYLNDQFVMDVYDGNLPSGGYGLFAYSDGFAPVSVSFSNFNLRELPQTN